ncbi:MAG: O-antigen ligase family protein [Thermoanaerobaculia bacterium]
MLTQAEEQRPVRRRPRRRARTTDMLDQLWATAILFMNGWILSLPVSETPLPFWLTPIQVVRGVFVYEVLFVAYLLTALLAHGGAVTMPRRTAFTVALLIAGLGFLGAVSGAVNQRPLKEFVSAARYLLLAAYFLAAVHWGRRLGVRFVLRGFLLGILAAGVVNIYYTFTINWAQVGGMPMLLGQNGPGGYLAMSVLLSAWLGLERVTTSDTALALSTAAVGVFAASISYSKLSMLIAGAGAAVWVLVAWRRIYGWRSHVGRFAVVAGLLLLLFGQRSTLLGYLKSVDTFVTYKFRSVDEESVGVRAQYFFITTEILLRNPVFGVGYGGFYDAATRTEAYKDSRSGREDPESGARGESNPHSSFLYYASANGFPGIALCVAIFVTTFYIAFHRLRKHGLHGYALWGGLVFAYLIFGLTLPTLFNTFILYLIAAVGTASWRGPLPAAARRAGPVSAPAGIK